MNKRFTGVSRAALEILLAYSWPGNVRELENAIERAMVMGREPELRPGDFPLQVGGGEQAEVGVTLEEVERAHILRVLEGCEWNQTRVAKMLEIDRVTLYNKIKKMDFGRVGRRANENPVAGTGGAGGGGASAISGGADGGALGGGLPDPTGLAERGDGLPRGAGAVPLDDDPEAVAAPPASGKLAGSGGDGGGPVHSHPDVRVWGSAVRCGGGAGAQRIGCGRSFTACRPTRVCCRNGC